ncbi:MAG: hypothetical protein KIG50_01010 [Lachnospiraceae bacterium]|nr:hypothetical protein [Lachnospiraceae bacterium]
MKKDIITPIKNLSKNYVRCGVLGWCIEILFTSLTQGLKKNRTLTGRTSIFMFPIYGAACLLSPLYPLIKRFSWPVRGIFYMNLIYLTEYLSGRFLMKKNCCPWDYSSSPLNYKKVIRLDFAPYWFATGLLYEKFLQKTP